MDISTASQTLLTKVKITSAMQAISKEARFRTVFPIIFSKSNPINRAPDGTTESEQNVEANKISVTKLTILNLQINIIPWTMSMGKRRSCSFMLYLNYMVVEVWLPRG